MGELKIRLKSDMCAGNGESVGYGIDSDICSDAYGFPYIPGKRLLGCMRDAAVKLGEYGLESANEDAINEIFGNANGKEGKLKLGNATISGIESLHDYIRSLKNEERKRDYLIRQCTEEMIIRAYSYVRGQTRIGDDGKADNGSLRFVRVLNQYDPFTGKELEFVCPMDATELSDEQKDVVEKACKTLHHIGLNRNRGLGNIMVIPETGEGGSENSIKYSDLSSGKSDQVKISYQLSFDSSVTVKEYMESGGQIKSRTMIGVFAKEYLKKNKDADEVFSALFLDGTVKWSALTPIINGIPSVPIPSMIMKLKNGGGKLVNVFACEDEDWRKKKPKSMDEFYASYDEDGKTVFVSQPETETNYHNRMEESGSKDRVGKGLYMQEALRQGMVYGGYVILPRERLSDVEVLLKTEKIRLGRSKKTQYGMASIFNIEVRDYDRKMIHLEDKEVVFAILRSDLILQNDAAFQVDDKTVRKAISEATGLSDIIPSGLNDICRYHVITGYNIQWHMQKPKIQAVMGGSIYCFQGEKGEIPSMIVMGEYQQEGMGIIELVPISKLKEIGRIDFGNISSRRGIQDSHRNESFEKKLLYGAAIKDLQEYAFKYKKKDDDRFYEDKILRNVPSRRLRQMLIDSETIGDLWNMVEEMKVSDVSSEFEGKKKKTEDLLNDFYGSKRNSIDLDRMIGDKGLLTELRKDTEVARMVEQSWKEPLSTLLHMVHYQKGR